jgi:hypothetical protein
VNCLVRYCSDYNRFKRFQSFKVQTHSFVAGQFRLIV